MRGDLFYLFSQYPPDFFSLIWLSSRSGTQEGEKDGECLIWVGWSYESRCERKFEMLIPLPSYSDCIIQFSVNQFVYFLRRESNKISNQSRKSFSHRTKAWSVPSITLFVQTYQMYQVHTLD